jgi:hypothetical protein
MITNDFFLAKDNYRIGAQIIRDHDGGRALVATPGGARLGSALPTMIVCRCGVVRRRGAPRPEQHTMPEKHTIAPSQVGAGLVDLARDAVGACRLGDRANQALSR